MHVVRDWTHIIEKFRVYRPAMIFSPDRFPDKLRAKFLDGGGKSEPIIFKYAVAQTLVWRSIFISCRCRGSKPAFIDATAVKTVGVDIIRRELEPAPGLKERPGTPTGGEPQKATTLLQSGINQSSE